MFGLSRKITLNYAVKVNNFGSYLIFAPPPGSGQFDTFMTYLIKVDKREVHRLQVKHIYVFLLFLVFSRKITLMIPGSCQFHMFFTYVIKLIKEKYFGYILSILCAFVLQLFQENYP